MAGLNFQTPIFNDWHIDARLSANYQDKQYLTPLNEAYVPSRTLVDGNVQLLSPQQNWEFALWVKNIADEEYAAGVLNILEQNKYMVSLGAPRTWGARLTYTF